ncbi:MAG: hypothetical protein KDE46_31600, partial [Caldilineaceae bacterium]|nr:hypothetical protein [Caldilineaceae bacterium]
RNYLVRSPNSGAGWLICVHAHNPISHFCIKAAGMNTKDGKLFKKNASVWQFVEEVSTFLVQNNRRAYGSIA